VLGEPPADAADESTPETELERRRSRERLERVLDALSPVKRATFVMFELEGSSCEEIAELSGVPVGTVHSRLFSARRDFARALARERATGRSTGV
jgi:RNA polymerase sigma-70 factor (ECF subfamily)